MTLIEAIKSGKHFRIKGTSCWMIPSSMSNITYANTGVTVPLLLSLLEADDWEIEEEEISLTAAEIKDAYWDTDKGLYGQRVNTNTFYQTFIRRLGFKS